jgi:hypothetical protein
MAVESFAPDSARLTSPARNAAAVTPSDTVDLPYVSRGIYVGGLGNLKVVMASPMGDATVTFTAVPVGVLLPIAVSRVMATGTTAANLVAIW